MKITHEPEQCAFVARDAQGNHMGEIEYKRGDDNRLSATHTRVDREFRGRGVAEALLDELAGYARDSGAKIVPICTYVQAAFKRSPKKYQDVMVKE